MEIFRLFGSISMNDKEIKNKLDSVDGKARKTSSNMGKNLAKAGKAFATFSAVASVALAGAAFKFTQIASEAEEIRGKFGVVFGDLEEGVRGWAEETAQSLGRSQIQLESFLAETQNMLVGMGSTREEGAKLSQQIVKLGVDLASFNNLAEDKALSNLQSAISGNHEASKSLGAVLNENTLALAMQEMQLQGTFQKLDENTKMQVRYQAIVNQSTDAIGDAERTSGSFANQLRSTKGMLKDISVAVGDAFLPIFTKGIKSLNNFLSWLQENNHRITAVFNFIANVTAIVFRTIGAIIADTIEFLSQTVINPFLKWFSSWWAKNQEDAANIVDTYWGMIQLTIQTSIDNIKSIFKIFKAVWSGDWDTVWEETKSLFSRTWGTMQTIFQTSTDLIMGILDSFMQIVLDRIEIMFGTNVRNVFESTWEIIKGIFDTTQQAILQLFDIWRNVFSGNWEEAWDGIVNYYKIIWNGISDVFEEPLNAASNFVGKVTTDIVSKFADMKDSAIGAVSGMVDDIKENLGKRLEKVTAPALNTISAINDKFAWLRDKVTGNSHIPDMVSDIDEEWDTLKENWDKNGSVTLSDISDGFAGLRDKAKDSAKKMKDNFIEEVNELPHTVVNIMKEVTSAITGPMDFGGVFESLASGDFAGAFNGLFSGISEESEAFEQVMQLFNDSFGQVIKSLLPIFNDLFLMLEPLIPIFSQILLTLGNMLASILQPLMPALESIFGLIAQLLQVIQPLIQPIAMVAGLLVQLIVSALQPLMPVIQVLAQLLTLLFNVLGPVIKIISKVLTPIFKVLALVVGTIANAFISIINAVIRALNKIPFVSIRTISKVDTSFSSNGGSDIPAMEPIEPMEPTGVSDGSGGNGGNKISNITGPTRDLLVDLLSPLANLNSLIGVGNRIYDLLDTRLPAMNGLALAGAGGSTSISIEQILVDATGGDSIEISENLVDTLEEELAERLLDSRRGGGAR